MQYKIYNDDFDVIIDSKGCEIISVVRKQDSKQYIWNGNPDAWKRHTPVLFPLVGRYKNDTSVYKGKEYHMTQHGFARDSEFSLVHKEDNVIIMKLISSEETKQKYPFDFELMITHRLSGNNISTIWEVKNTGDDVMYFSIGGHPAFVCGDNAIGAQLRFDTEDDKVAYKLLISFAIATPFCDSLSITSVLLKIEPILESTVVAVADVSSILAASSSDVAELSSLA